MFSFAEYAETLFFSFALSFSLFPKSPGFQTNIVYNLLRCNYEPERSALCAANTEINKELISSHFWPSVLFFL